MKALSLTQPWCYAITHLGKRIENRVKWRGCSYRGPIWLHASATAGKAFHECAEGLRDTLQRNDASDLAWESFRDLHLDIRSVRGSAGPVRDVRYAPRSSLPMGAIVGHARIVDVIRTRREDFKEPASDFDRWVDEGVLERDFDREAQRAWWFGGFALVLDEVTAIEPVPCKGALGLWKVPEEIEARAMAALEKARAT